LAVVLGRRTDGAVPPVHVRRPDVQTLGFRGSGVSRIVVSDEALALIEWAQDTMVSNAPSRQAALDWLLRDLCEYGSPVVGAQARKTWPDSVETREWERKHPGRTKP